MKDMGKSRLSKIAGVGILAASMYFGNTSNAQTTNYVSVPRTISGPFQEVIYSDPLTPQTNNYFLVSAQSTPGSTNIVQERYVLENGGNEGKFWKNVDSQIADTNGVASFKVMFKQDVPSRFYQVVRKEVTE